MKKRKLFNQSIICCEKTWGVTRVLLLILLLLPGTAFGQQGRGQGAMKDSAHHEPFNVETIEMVSGKITHIDQLPGRREGMVGVHATVKTQNESIEVHLGPLSYLMTKDFQVKVGDVLTVKGSRITNNNKPALLAVEVTRDDEVIVLRDEQGKPLWRKQGKKGKQGKHGN